jgi:hypothetical protein
VSVPPCFGVSSAEAGPVAMNEAMAPKAAAHGPERIAAVSVGILD